jgi:hypothetical protein
MNQGGDGPGARSGTVTTASSGLSAPPYPGTDIPSVDATVGVRFDTGSECYATQALPYHQLHRYDSFGIVKRSLPPRR